MKRKTSEKYILILLVMRLCHRQCGKLDSNMRNKSQDKEKYLQHRDPRLPQRNASIKFMKKLRKVYQNRSILVQLQLPGVNMMRRKRKRSNETKDPMFASINATSLNKNGFI